MIYVKYAVSTCCVHTCPCSQTRACRGDKGGRETLSPRQGRTETHVKLSHRMSARACSITPVPQQFPDSSG